MNNKLLFIFIALLGIVAFFVIFEHRVHLYGFMPYVFFVIFVGLHFFMHAGMGHGEKNKHDNNKKEEGGNNHE